MKQNIYDNDEFFRAYKALRETDNNLIEGNARTSTFAKGAARFSGRL